ncbi:MAG: MarC family protein [Alphaproteobacteria bacterium]|nr:MarC family protein [Alphaproteobacteria bacterium]
MIFFSEFNFKELIGAFVVLLAICDVPGNLPIVLNIQKKGIHISARRAFWYSLFLMVFFFYAGEAFLHLFGLDISSFAIAGALIIFLISIEMILDINLFCEGTDISSDATLVPIVFPLFIGAGVLTTLLSIRSQYSDINVLLAAFLNCVMIYCTIKLSRMLKKYISQTCIYVVKKFFGMVLLAISVKLFITNITLLISSVQG